MSSTTKTYRYQFQGRCAVHGLVFTSGYSLTAPPLCPVDQLNTYTDVVAHTRRLEPVYDITYNEKMTTSNNDYTIVGNVYWPGTNTIGYLNKIIITAIIDNDDTGAVKIYDEKNRVDIAEITTINKNSVEKYETVDIKNLSSTETIISIQLKVNKTSNIQVYEVIFE